MNTKHSEPFYISSNLFDNKRLKRRLSKWMERLRERQQLYMAPATKTERSGGKRCHLMMLSRRHVAAALPADITIDLLSDDDDDDDHKAPDLSVANGHHLPPSRPTPGSLQISTMPNISLVPVELAPAHSSTMLLMPAASRGRGGDDGKLFRPRKRYADVTTTFTDSIVLTSDEENGMLNYSRRQLMRSPPPLAPLTFSDNMEEVTVSLVPRTSTTANCQARQRRRQPRDASFSQPNSCSSTPSNTATNHFDGYLNVDVGSDVTATLPDETTVHTVIANRIYELSLSKLREGLASSGVPEYAHDLLPEQLQKLSPAMRAKVAPMVAPSPPAPISLKLSSDLSISLISDDDECDGGNAGSGGYCKSTDVPHPVVAAEAHAAAKLLKQQQPQLSVVQHLQYPGHGSPVALPVVAPPTLTGPQSTRRRKLG
ncbi:protein a6 [Drosophila montana]|uniref:protein a6 n=1 Tax=Drosophila montana TaxID=40370 RepID=UPI00313E48AF